MQIVGNKVVIVGLETLGSLIVTIALAVPWLQLPVTETVYVVVTVGVAMGFWQFVQLKPVAGLHKYVLALLDCKTVESPMHIVGFVTVIVGGKVLGWLTVIVTLAVPLEQVPVTETVYVVVMIGDATGFAQVVQLNPVAGLQIKVPPVFTDNVVESPTQKLDIAADAIGVEVPDEK